jgi:catechol 2,3-dioxygenase-like lactoylglutathione lyase family enzyme
MNDFHHVGLSIEDLDAMVPWYESALGLRPVHRFDLPEGARGAMMEHPSGTYRVELLEHPESAAGIRDAEPGVALQTRGYGHFALLVEDLESTHEELTAAGARSVWGPRDAPEPGVRIAFLHDPEGNLIELLERS